MRICHIATRFIRGGADENTAHCCNGQVKAGHDVHLIIGREANPKQLETLMPEIRVWRAQALIREIAPLSDVCGLVQLVSLIRDIKPDIVHTHLSKAGILGRIAAYISRVPIIVHTVHILPFINVGWSQGLFYRILERIAALVTDAFISVGNEMRDECLRFGIGHRRHHSVIPSGMDLGRFAADLRKEVRWSDVFGKHGLATSNPQFLLIVSRLEARKRQVEFLSVFAEIAREFPDIVLVIAGEGPDYARITTRAIELALTDRVIMAGYREDIERLMAVADVGVLTSIREGLPRVLVQYAMMGLPIVATDIPGAREIVTPGINGFLVPPNDLMAMRGPLRQLLREPETCRKFAVAQGRLDLSGWSIEGMNKQIEQVYRGLRHGRIN